MRSDDVSTILALAAAATWIVFGVKVWRVRRQRLALRDRLTPQWLNEQRGKRWQ